MIAERIQSLGLALPPAPQPIGNYVPALVSGSLLFVSGQGPKDADGRWIAGRLGDTVGVEEGYRHARLAGLRILAAAQGALGSLDRIRRVVKLGGFVRATDDFRDHPKVINGCSDLMVEIFGEAGRHARTAVGVGSLPEGITIEIDAIFEISRA